MLTTEPPIPSNIPPTRPLSDALSISVWITLYFIFDVSLSSTVQWAAQRIPLMSDASCRTNIRTVDGICISVQGRLMALIRVQQHLATELALRVCENLFILKIRFSSKTLGKYGYVTSTGFDGYQRIFSRIIETGRIGEQCLEYHYYFLYDNIPSIMVVSWTRPSDGFVHVISVERPQAENRWYQRRVTFASTESGYTVRLEFTWWVFRNFAWTFL